MSFTVTRDKGALHVRAVITTHAEIEQLIHALKIEQLIHALKRQLQTKENPSERESDLSTVSAKPVSGKSNAD